MTGIQAMAGRPIISIKDVWSAAYRSGVSPQEMLERFEAQGYRIGMSSNDSSWAPPPQITIPQRQQSSTAQGRSTSSPPAQARGIGAFIGTALETAGREAVKAMLASRSSPPSAGYAASSSDDVDQALYSGLIRRRRS